MNVLRNAGDTVFYRGWPWLLLALVLLSIATTRATFRVPQLTYRYLFVLDVTQSMNVTDVEIGEVAMTRLDFAKSAIATALKRLPCGSEAGLAIFTGHRTFVMFTPIEICGHFEALDDMLAKIDWRMAWEARSEIAKGLYSAFSAAHTLRADTRLVFLTDGHEAPPINPSILPSFRGEPGSVAGLIAGIGGPLPSKIPHLNDDGDIVGYWSHAEVMQVDIHSLGRTATEGGEAMAGIDVGDIARRIALGQEHLSSLREPYLQDVALRTGLDYLRLETPEIFVATLQGKKYARRMPVMTDLAWIPASLALACLIYCFVVLPRLNRSEATRALV